MRFPPLNTSSWVLITANSKATRVAKVHKKCTKTCIQIGPIQLAAFAKNSLCPALLLIPIILLLVVSVTAIPPVNNLVVISIQTRPQRWWCWSSVRVPKWSCPSHIPRGTQRSGEQLKSGGNLAEMVISKCRSYQLGVSGSVCVSDGGGFRRKLMAVRLKMSTA